MMQKSSPLRPRSSSISSAGVGTFEEAFKHARALLRKREFALALSQVDEILKVHPDDARALFFKGVVKRNLGANEEALGLLDTVAGLAPENAAVHQERGFVLRALGNSHEAIGALRAAVALDHGLGACWRLLGELLAMEGREGESQEAFRNHLAALAASFLCVALTPAIDPEDGWRMQW